MEKYASLSFHWSHDQNGHHAKKRNNNKKTNKKNKKKTKKNTFSLVQ